MDSLYCPSTQVKSSQEAMPCIASNAMCSQALQSNSKVLSLCQKKNLSLLFPLWAKSFGQFSSLAHYPLSLGFSPKNHFGVGYPFTILYLVCSNLLHLHKVVTLQCINFQSCTHSKVLQGQTFLKHIDFQNHTFFSLVDIPNQFTTFKMQLLYKKIT